MAPAPAATAEAPDGACWEIVVGDRPLCTTPCERWVDPGIPYSLKHDPGIFQRNEFVELPDLRKYAALEWMDVRVIPRHMGEIVPVKSKSRPLVRQQLNVSADAGLRLAARKPQ